MIRNSKSWVVVTDQTWSGIKKPRHKSGAEKSFLEYCSQHWGLTITSTSVFCKNAGIFFCTSSLLNERANLGVMQIQINFYSTPVRTVKIILFRLRCSTSLFQFNQNINFSFHEPVPEVFDASTSFLQHWPISRRFDHRDDLTFEM